MAINAAAVDGAVQEFRNQMFADAVTKKQHFFGLLPQLQPSSPQGPRWKVKTAGNASATAYAEGAAAPAADEFDYLSPQMDWGQYATTVQITGLASDILSISGDAYIDQYLAKQFEDAFEQLVDQINTDLMGATAANGMVGVQTAISPTGTYAGLDRSTVANWQSYSNNNSGTPRALTTALMDTTHRNFVDTRGGQYDRIYASQQQVDAYTALTSGNGFPAPRTFNVSGTENLAIGGFGGLDPLQPSAFYRGRPIYAIPGYASDLMHFVDGKQLHLEVLKGITVKPLAQVNDDMSWLVTWKGQLVLVNPRKGACVLDDLS